MTASAPLQLALAFHWLRRLWAALVWALLPGASGSALAQPTWSIANSLVTVRDTHTATLLQSGKVLVARRTSNSGSLASAQL